jgi:hypothetical protein
MQGMYANYASQENKNSTHNPKDILERYGKNYILLAYNITVLLF